MAADAGRGVATAAVPSGDDPPAVGPGFCCCCSCRRRYSSCCFCLRITASAAAAAVSSEIGEAPSKSRRRCNARGAGVSTLSTSAVVDRAADAARTADAALSADVAPKALLSWASEGSEGSSRFGKGTTVRATVCEGIEFGSVMEIAFVVEIVVVIDQIFLAVVVVIVVLFGGSCYCCWVCCYSPVVSQNLDLVYCPRVSSLC